VREVFTRGIGLVEMDVDFTPGTERLLDATAPRRRVVERTIERFESVRVIVQAKIGFAESVLPDAEVGANAHRTLQDLDGLRVLVERDVRHPEVPEREMRRLVVHVGHDFAENRQGLLRAVQVHERRAERVLRFVESRDLLGIVCGDTGEKFDRAAKMRLRPLV
jgi:hypothetical protein